MSGYARHQVVRIAGFADVIVGSATAMNLKNS